MIQELKIKMMEAMKAGDTKRANVIRMLMNELQVEEKSKNRKRTDGEVLLSYKKKIQDAIEIYPENKKDLLRGELLIVEEFCPKQFSENEIKTEIETLIKDGKIIEVSMKSMGQIAALLRGKASGKEISKVVREWN